MIPVWRGGVAERYEPCPKGRGEWSKVCPNEAVVALDNVLATYYEGKQIALHQISWDGQAAGKPGKPQDEKHPG